MKYDPSTANVDRWHGMTDDDMSKGFKTIDQDVPSSPNDVNNLRQLNGGCQPADDDLAEMSD